MVVRKPLTAPINLAQIVLIPAVWMAIVLAYTYWQGESLLSWRSGIAVFIAWQITLFYTAVLIDVGWQNNKSDVNDIIFIGGVVLILATVALGLASSFALGRVLGGILIGFENLLAHAGAAYTKRDKVILDRPRLTRLVIISYVPPIIMITVGAVETLAWTWMKVQQLLGF